MRSPNNVGCFALADARTCALIRRGSAYVLWLIGLMFVLGVSARADTIAVLAPDGSEMSVGFAAGLSERLGARLRVLDQSLADTAYSSSPPANPFNLTSAEAMRIGTVIGSDAVIIVRTGSQRRSSSERPAYYETFGVVYAFTTRSGAMIYWDLPSSEASTSVEAKRRFSAQLGTIAARLEAAVRTGIKAELSAADPPAFPDASDSDKIADFRAPVPYKRIKPVYTELASLYDVRATLDVIVYLNEKGEIVRTDVTRWAGFGLDGSVTDNIRSMNWRPAMVGGKPVATKFLVRYNFKKGE